MIPVQSTTLTRPASATKAADVAIIIVSYNTREMTLHCLHTLFDALPEINSEVWVVDNASVDGSVDAIREGFPQVQLIANVRNAGFGAANNQAMLQSKAEFFLLLNSDAFIEPDTISHLQDYLRRNPGVAVCGPRLHSKDGSLQISCFRFPSPARAWLENLWVSAAFAHHPVVGDYRRWSHNTVRRVEFVVGACMIVRRVAYEQVGGFDETFFMYGEEADWQRRMHNAGWEVAFTPQARVTHLGGASGASQQPAIERHLFDSLDYYERKHHGISGLISLRCAMVVGCLLRVLLWSAASLRPKMRTLAFARAKMHSWLLLRQTLHWELRL